MREDHDDMFTQLLFILILAAMAGISLGVLAVLPGTN